MLLLLLTLRSRSGELLSTNERGGVVVEKRTKIDSILLWCAKLSAQPPLTKSPLSSRVRRFSQKFCVVRSCSPIQKHRRARRRRLAKLKVELCEGIGHGSIVSVSGGQNCCALHPSVRWGIPKHTRWKIPVQIVLRIRWTESVLRGERRIAQITLYITRITTRLQFGLFAWMDEHRSGPLWLFVWLD